jgi:hypothetical protein
VFGTSSNGTGVYGEGPGAGVIGRGGNAGLSGVSQSGNAVRGASHRGTGVYGECFGGTAPGVVGHSGGNVGVRGSSVRSTGVVAISSSGTGVFGEGGFRAGTFNGHVAVFGDLTVTGRKPFKIDHPLDPQNKYLLHNVVESSEMKNVYDGVVQLDEEGAAWVELPEWFEALNGDFRYQLTAVGASAPNLHVAEEISENRFRIAGGQGGMKVCWQLTGTRKDPWAAANPFEVEQEKPEEERGRYLHPGLYDAPEEQSVLRARMGEEQWRAMREAPPSFEPPQVPPPVPPDVAAPGFDVVRLQQQLDELRGQLEEQRRGRMEDEIDELRRQIKKLRRRRRKR